MFRKYILVTPQKWNRRSPPSNWVSTQKIHSCSQNFSKKEGAGGGGVCGSEGEKIKNEDEKLLVFESMGDKGIIILNRPKVLNVLNLAMITKMYSVLKEWETSKKFVIIKGAGGKAFCAGGDVVASTKSLVACTSYGPQVIVAEYRLSGLVGSLRIPYVALIDGITMGAGAGISVHGDYRVATEKTVFCMPENAIGFFPDVGASHFLSRLRGGMGLGIFLGVTGHRLKSCENLQAGIATHMCSRGSLPSLEKDLVSMDTSGLTSSSIRPAIEKILNQYNDTFPESPGPSGLTEKNLEKINTIFDGHCVEEMVTKLKKDKKDPWSSEVLKEMDQMCPTSMKVSAQLIRRGAALSDLQECLQMEYRVAHRFAKEPNFVEGVRALLIDKDQKPKWKPPKLVDVSDAYVDSVFEPLESGKDLTFD